MLPMQASVRFVGSEAPGCVDLGTAAMLLASLAREQASSPRDPPRCPEKANLHNQMANFGPLVNNFFPTNMLMWKRSHHSLIVMLYSAI